MTVSAIASELLLILKDRELAAVVTTDVAEFHLGTQSVLVLDVPAECSREFVWRFTLRKRLVLVLILALTFLTAIGAKAPRTSGCGQHTNATCKSACDNAFNSCLASGTSFHQCLGDLHRCNKSCQ